MIALALEHFRVLLGLADPHVDRDLLEPRRLHHRGVAEAVDKCRANLLEIAGLEAGCGGGGSHGNVGRRCVSAVAAQSIAAPERLATRERSPPSRSIRTRVGWPPLGSSSITFEMWIGPSRSITPPLTLPRPAPPIVLASFICCGRMWRLVMFRP